VLRRNDGTPAYNLAVVVDDGAQGVGEVVRADDLLPSTPRQIHLARLLGLEPPAYAHVPLVLAADGSRLAKRHGAVTLGDRRALGEEPAQVLGRLAASLNLVEAGHPVRPSELNGLALSFEVSRLPRSAWVFSDE
jgi:glutamyl-tRNA synthetase